MAPGWPLVKSSPVNARLLSAVLAAAAFTALGIVPAGAHEARPSYVMHCGLPNLATGARPCTYTFTHNREVETFVVPPASGPIRITAVGAPGFGEDAIRSHGAKVTGSVPFLAGTILFVVVGGDGYYDGYNGGIDGGGGASDVREGGYDLKHRIIVAGGGGGAGERLIFDKEQSLWRFIVVKGGDAGQPGFAAGAGQPGGATAGGAGGGNEPQQGRPGTLGRGGFGAERGGGGGGGGLYGGGGGGGCYGGDDTHTFCQVSQPGICGGGSSLVPPGGTVTLSQVLEPSVTITVDQFG